MKLFKRWTIFWAILQIDITLYLKDIREKMYMKTIHDKNKIIINTKQYDFTLTVTYLKVSKKK